MEKPNAFANGHDDRPILPWRLVGGAFLHFIVPTYLVVLVLNALLSAPRGATAETLLHHALPFSGWFLLSYAGVSLLATASAAVIDPLLRARRASRALRDPQARALLSAKRLAMALSRGRELFGGEGNAHLMAIQAMRWDHDDLRVQALASDLDDVVTTSAVALADAMPDRKPMLTRRAVDSLARIQGALHELDFERSRRAESDAEAVARYLETRYGGSDFASSAD